MHPNREPPHQRVTFPPLDWPETGITTPADPDAPTFPTGPGAMVLTGTRGQPITPFQIPATATGGPITAYGASNLPAGLTVDTTTGIISGTPTATVTNRRVTVSATNAEGTTRGTLLVTISAPGTGPVPTPPWATDLTFSFPGTIQNIGGVNMGGTPFNFGLNGKIPLSALTGWDPAYQVDFTDAKLYPTPLHTLASVPIKLYATFAGGATAGVELQIDFDATTDGSPTGGPDKVTMWGYSSGDNSIYLEGSNGTGGPIALRLEKP